jgi:crotonobetainyl-CoA:carnitine CoA-transferase CaiB-like acyl-CoA transferase
MPEILRAQSDQGRCVEPDNLAARKTNRMALLKDLEVLQIGPGLGAAVCTRLLADCGAQVTCIDHDSSSPLGAWLNHAKSVANTEEAERAALTSARLIVREVSSKLTASSPYSLEALRRSNPNAVVVTISPYGQSGPQAEDPATDLTLFYASGVARLLTGQVDDLSEPPLRAVGEQSAFIGGLAAACAGMHAVLGNQPGACVDVSLQEALATLAMTELSRAGQSGKSWERKRTTDGNGATVTILPANDGFTAISPREDKQWAAWLSAMGSPAWGRDPRFATKPDRIANWDALHALMSAWSRQHDKQWIADLAQAAHVPSFPLREVAEHLDAPQLRHRAYFRSLDVAGRTLRAPGVPFGLEGGGARLRLGLPFGSPQAGERFRGKARFSSETSFPSHTLQEPPPLSGVRVLDFSWVIAGPTTTRYLAAMGAEVIKVEAPGKGDPGRSSGLHTVLGQGKQGIVLDLKKPEAVEIARLLAAKSDVLIENFATGVMDRLGLGAEALKALNPNLVYISASGMGRTGPDAHAVAYGTLLQSYAGFAGLNRHPGVPPRIGFAWLDPMCALMLAFVTAAALWHRNRTGEVARIDFSMLEAMLWTMAEPLLATQLGAPPQPAGNDSLRYAPHGAWQCAGSDEWIAIAVRSDAEWRALCATVPALSARSVLDFDQRIAAKSEIDALISEWAKEQSAHAAAARLLNANVPAAALARFGDLVKSPHLAARGFWDRHGSGVLPALPWQASFGRRTGPAPALGADTDRVLTEVLELPPERIAALRAGGALG